MSTLTPDTASASEKISESQRRPLALRQHCGIEQALTVRGRCGEDAGLHLFEGTFVERKGGVIELLKRYRRDLLLVGGSELVLQRGVVARGEQRSKDGDPQHGTNLAEELAGTGGHSRY